jgi:hypothetical protein
VGVCELDLSGSEQIALLTACFVNKMMNRRVPPNGGISLTS